MSINLMSAIFRTEFRDLKDEAGNTTKASTAKFICIALADHANDEGEGAYPSIDTMAYKTNLSRTAVINALDVLKYNGILIANGTSKRHTIDYTINKTCFSNDSQRGVLVNLLDSGGQPTLLEGVNPLDPNRTITIHETDKLSPKDLEQVNAKVDAIIGNSARADWTGREAFRSDHYPLVDWYHKVTGQDCPMSKRKDWMKAVSLWSSNALTVADLQRAYDMDIKWRGVFTSPNQLTDKAIALKAQKQAKPQEMTRML